MIKSTSKDCNLYYCQCPEAPNNVGNIFGPFLLRHLSAENVKINITGPSKSVTSPSLMLGGSIVQDSQKGCVISGCGILSKNDKIIDFLDCRLVRGQYTLNKILECKPNYDKKIILGDASLALPYIMKTKITKKIYKYGIILHYVDKRLSYYFNKNPQINMIEINNGNILNFADRIMECESIISSSLHGLIVANSLCIPTAWIRLPGTLLPQDNIKFYDYFSIYKEIGLSPSCNHITTQLSLSEIGRLTFYSVNSNFMIKKTAEIMNCIVETIKQYAIIKDKYNRIYDNIVGSNLFINKIRSPNKFLISRIGGIELDLYLQYKLTGAESLINSYKYSIMKKYAGYYDEKDDPNNIIKYCDLFEKCYKNSEIIMIANANLSSYTKLFAINHPYYTDIWPDQNSHSMIERLLKNKIAIDYHGILESFEYFNQWFPLLDGKKILIISPFDNEIRNQLQFKDELFPKHFLKKYPNFRSVDYVHTYLTLDNYEKPHKNWFETYNYYCSQIDSKNFDIALLFCGCYAYPLSNYIYEKIGKSAIIVGGIGQLLFGIRGKRYENAYFQRFMNTQWIYRTLAKNSDGFKNEGLNAYFINN